MDAPFCKLCGTKHRLGQHTAFQSSRGGVERRSGDDKSDTQREPRRSKDRIGELTVPPRELKRARSQAAKAPGFDPGIAGSNPAASAKPQTKTEQTKESTGEKVMVKSAKKKKRKTKNNAKRLARERRKKRKVKLGRPFKGKEGETLSAQQPWRSLGWSRAKYYRLRGKAKKDHKRQPVV